MNRQFRQEGLEQFAASAARHVGEDKMPGLVALVAHGDDTHVEVLGDASIGGAPMKRDSLFRIASTTKPVTGAAALALSVEGLLDLDEPVDRLLPELANPRVLARMDGSLEETVAARRAITARDLMTFTFGFGFVIEMFTASEPWPVVQAESALDLCTLGPPNPQRQPDPDTYMAQLASLPLIAQPGERWMYNTGASVLGVLLARAAEMPLAEVLRTRIFEPLGMSDTAFWTSETDRLPTEYRASPEGLQVWDEPEGQWSHPPAFADGAGGLLSTADDLLSFARMLLAGGGDVLSPDAVRAMTSDQLSEGQRHGAEAFLQERSWGFCQAVITSGARTGAFGWDGGLGTSWLVDPVRDLVVISLTQRMWDTAQPPLVHKELQAAAYSAIGDQAAAGEIDT